MTGLDPSEDRPGPIFAHLLHLSMNMWSDRPNGDDSGYSADLRCDDRTWYQVTDQLARVGATMVVLDLGDGVQYRSHPEIAVRGAWTVERLSAELGRLRSLGLEPIPKLNFSATHDAWLGDHGRQLATPSYHRVCTELIQEVSELFGRPRFFHLGMDEENAADQAEFSHVAVRQHDLWWDDFDLLCDVVRGTGARPWMWADHVWGHPEEFYARMPRDVVQTNWYYGTRFTGEDETDRPRPVALHSKYLAYLDLDDHGFSQIAGCSNWTTPDNVRLTAEFCRERLNPTRFLGVLQAPWKSTTPANLAHHLEAIAALATARTQLSDPGTVQPRKDR